MASVTRRDLTQHMCGAYLRKRFLTPSHARFDIPDQGGDVAAYVCRVVRALLAGNGSIDVFVIARFDDWIFRVGTKFGKVYDLLGLVPVRAVSHYRDQVALTRIIL